MASSFGIVDGFARGGNKNDLVDLGTFVINPFPFVNEGGEEEKEFLKETFPLSLSLSGRLRILISVSTRNPFSNANINSCDFPFRETGY